MGHKQDILNRLINIFAEQLGLIKDEYILIDFDTEVSDLYKKYYIDSLHEVVLIMQIEDEFDIEIPDYDAESFKDYTVEKIVLYIYGEIEIDVKPVQKTNETKEGKEMKQFTKKDLKTGMVLEFNDGNLGMVLRGTENGDIVSGKTWFSFNHLHDDLAISSGIMKVVAIYQPRTNMDYLRDGITKNHQCIWTRKEPRKTVKVGDKEYYEDELSEALSKINPVNE